MLSLAANIAPQHDTSLNPSHTIMAREGYQRNDWCILTLNEAVEDALSKILRFGFDIDRDPLGDTAKLRVTKSIKDQILAWAKHIAGNIPGFSNWQEIYDFTFDALYSPDAIPGEDATPVGTEADLVARIGDPILERNYNLLGKDTEKEHLTDYALSLIKARGRQEILDRVPASDLGGNPMPHDVALLFHKIRYTYKLRECLLGQIGYHRGSLELAADMSDTFEYYMYLIQMKLRRPDRLHVFKAPKVMASYTTDSMSLLPWNNQFSFSHGLDESGPRQMPVFGVSYIERKFVEVLRLDKENKKWRGLCTLLNWDPKDHIWEHHRIKEQFITPEQAANTGIAGASGHFLAGNLTLSECGFRALNLINIMYLMTYNDTGRKAFYTLFLDLTWSKKPQSIGKGYSLAKESEEYEIQDRKSSRTGAIINYDLAHLLDDNVKDPRITEGYKFVTLARGRYYPHVFGRKTNLTLTPETAGDDYRRKLLRLSEADLDQLFHNIPDYPRTESQPAKVDAVVNQAIYAAQDWQTHAVQNHRPIYTGPSGHMLSYARIFLTAENPSGCGKKDHPNIEQLRLTLLAASIGFNQHHSYDECMTASHGLTHGSVMLEYKDRIGYRDIIDSEDPFIRNHIGKQLLKAMIMIGKEVIYDFKEQGVVPDPPFPSWEALVSKWFKDTTGRDFPVIN